MLGPDAENLSLFFVVDNGARGDSCCSLHQPSLDDLVW